MKESEVSKPIKEKKLTVSDFGTHADTHHWDGTDPLTAADVYAEPDLGDVGSAGVYGIQESVLGLHGIAPINRTNIIDVNKLVKTIETDTYTVEDTDEVIICNKSTAMFVYIPATTGTGQRLYIKNINTGDVTIDCSATEVMDDIETIDLAQWEYVELVSSDTGKWVIVGRTGGFAGTMDDIPDGTTYVKTENNFTDALSSKLSGIADGAEVNVNADWNAGGGDAQILNKPTIPADISDLTDEGGLLNAGSGLTQPQIMARTLGCQY